MAMSIDEWRTAIEKAIVELADAAGLSADDATHPGTTAMRRMAADRQRALEWEMTEHIRLAEEAERARAAAQAHDKAETERAKAIAQSMAAAGIRRIGR